MTERLPNYEQEPKIGGFVIPTDTAQPLRIAEQFELNNLERYQETVGGNIQALNLIEPGATLYINDESKFNGSLFNPRATAILWMHNPAFRFADGVSGDAILVGAHDGLGGDASAPDELIHMITDPRERQVEVRMAGEREWRVHDSGFADWFEAYIKGFYLLKNKPGIADLRVTISEGV